MRVATKWAAVLLLALINKGERADLSKAEKNELCKLLLRYAKTYRDGAMRMVHQIRSRT